MGCWAPLACSSQCRPGPNSTGGVASHQLTHAHKILTRLLPIPVQVWTERLREWFAGRVLQPLVAAVDSAHADANKVGLPFNSLWNASLHIVSCMPVEPIGGQAAHLPDPSKPSPPSWHSNQITPTPSHLTDPDQVWPAHTPATSARPRVCHRGRRRCGSCAEARAAVVLRTGCSVGDERRVCSGRAGAGEREFLRCLQ